MRKFLFLLIFLLPSSTFAAIARDTSANLGSGGAGANITHTYTEAAGNSLLVVCVMYSRNSGGATLPVSVTFNGQNLTASETTGTQITTHGFSSLWWIVGQSGTANIVITNRTGDDMFGSATSYTGVSQTGQPDAHAAVGTTGTTVTTNITTNINNSWLIGCGGDQVNGPFPTPGANTTFVVTTNGQAGQYDSNGPITPAGATSMSGTDGGNSGSTIGLAVASFSPPTAVVASPLLGYFNEMWW